MRKETRTNKTTNQLHRTTPNNDTQSRVSLIKDNHIELASTKSNNDLNYRAAYALQLIEINTEGERSNNLISRD